VFEISFYNSFLQIDTYFSHLPPSSEVNLFHEVFIVRSSTRGLRASVANTLRPFPRSTSQRTIGLCGAEGVGWQTICHVHSERSKTLCTKVKIRGNFVFVQAMRAIFCSGGLTGILYCLHAVTHSYVVTKRI